MSEPTDTLIVGTRTLPVSNLRRRENVFPPSTGTTGGMEYEIDLPRGARIVGLEFIAGHVVVQYTRAEGSRR